MTYRPVKFPTQLAPKRKIRQMLTSEAVELLERVRAEFGSAYGLRLLDEVIDGLKGRTTQ